MLGANGLTPAIPGAILARRGLLRSRGAHAPRRGVRRRSILGVGKDSRQKLTDL
jgi:hypothetical protein